jgi:hypothetical protein
MSALDFSEMPATDYWGTHLGLEFLEELPADRKSANAPRKNTNS